MLGLLEKGAMVQKHWHVNELRNYGWGYLVNLIN